MMTMEAFMDAKATLVEMYGQTPKEAQGKRAMALAQLYIQSEWKQRDICAVEGFPQPRVHQLMLYGRFLDWRERQASGGVTIVEREFHRRWGQTKQTLTPEERFAVIAACIPNDTIDLEARLPAMPPHLPKEILTKFGDGRWHRLRIMAEIMETDLMTVGKICDQIVTQGTFQTFGERRPAPPAEGAFAYRFVRGGNKTLNLAAFYAEVQPVLDDMDKVINGPRVDFSQQAMKMAFVQFRQVIDRMAR